MVTNTCFISHSFIWDTEGLGWIKANCLLVGPGPVGLVPSVGVLLKILACIYASFGENHVKLRMAMSTKARPGIELGISSLSVLSAEPLSHWWGLLSYDIRIKIS